MAKVNISIYRAEKLIKEVPLMTHDMENEVALKAFTQYLFYKPAGRNRRRFFCTACQGIYELGRDSVGQYEQAVMKGSHLSFQICPNCFNNATLASLGRYRSGASLCETHNILYFRNTEEGLYAVAGHAGLDYDITNQDHPWPTLYLFEQNIYFFGPEGERAEWRYRTHYDYDHNVGWHVLNSGFELMRNIKEPFNPIGAMGYNPGYDGGYYVFGTDEIYKSPFTKYCAYEYYDHRFEEGAYIRGLMTYLGEYSKSPALEMVAKLKMHDIISDIIYEGRNNGRYVNWKAKSPDRFLKLSKEETRIYLKHGCTLHELIAWKESGKKEPLEEYIFMGKAFGGQEYRAAAEAICCRLGITLKQLYQYLAKQKGGKGVVLSLFQLWKDYIDNCEKLKYDLKEQTVMFPKNLVERHDMAAAAVTYQQDAELNKAYRRRYRTLKKKYEFERYGVRIVIPNTASEIVKEGNALKHCVGGYADRHMRGAVTILFLRKAQSPDEPYVTIEMGGTGGNSIRQIHGYRNDLEKGAVSPRVTHADFLKDWLEWLDSGSQRTKQGVPIVKPVKGSEAKSKTA